MIILIEFSSSYEEKAKKVLPKLVTSRDGPGFRPLYRPTYYFPLNDIRIYHDGQVKLLFEVGAGAKQDFYANVVTPLKMHLIPVHTEEFLTEADLRDQAPPVKRKRITRLFRRGRR